MTISWGTKITLLYCSFVLLITFLVIGSIKHPSALVADNYYEQEVGFQKRLDATNNATALSASVDVKATGSAIQLKFPKEIAGQDVKVTVHFYAPANAGADRTFLLSTSDGALSVERSKILKARYLVQLDWRMAGKEYFSEIPLNLLVQ